VVPLSKIRTLDQLPSGHSAEILHVHTQGVAGVRLMEMGLFEGTRVTLLRRAPLGDPLELQVGDFRLSLRAADAAQVELKPEAGS
jgi:Fe2+ transport system protein FeoA